MRTAGASSFIFTRGIATLSFAFPSKGATSCSSIDAKGEAAGVAVWCGVSPWRLSSYAITSSFLYWRKRDNISSKSTLCASNSGPSTQTNLVLPSTVTRQAPHIPVPSTMMVFKLASVGILYFLVVNATNFIMIAGPMVTHLSTCSRLITCSTPSVTRPFCPMEPSSVITITSSDTAASWSWRMISSRLRAANTVITRLPAALRACAIGNIGAAPTPPHAQTTVPKLRISVALPRGPTKSAT